MITEEGRAFLQERVALFGKWIFWPAFVFLCISYPPDVIAGGRPLSALLRLQPLAHLSGVLILFAMWRYCRRGVRPIEVLRLLEGPGVLAVLLLWAAMGFGFRDLTFAGEQRVTVAVTGVFTVILACTHTVMARAITIPSTPRRTLAIGVAGMAPAVALAPVLMRGAGVETGAVIGATIAASAWIAAAVVISAVASGVIYGLRREVARSRQLGQYTLESEIGAGGMGVVYRARHAMLRRPTAIKLLSPDKTGEDSIRRFEREVQLTARLSHPNTVSVYDYGRTPDGLFYYAMEYLDGVDLERLVRTRGPLGAARAIAVLDQICGSLAEAHDIGLIHRDIKPANVIVGPRGGEHDVVKVVDFGLVKEIDEAGVDTSLTGANVITGTPAYLAPEAIRGAEIDARADLYAVGAVGYWLITGRSVFEADTVVEMCSHHLHSAPVPPAERAPDLAIPDDLAAVLLRCLEKNVAARPESARALRDQLRRCDDAGAWSETDARAWWSENAEQLSREPVERAAMASTVAIDLEGRV